MTDTVITNKSWVDLNTATSTTVGLDVRIQNKGNYGVIFQVADTQPDADDDDGAYITSANLPTPYIDFVSETQTIYARVFNSSTDTKSCRLNVSEI